MFRKSLIVVFALFLGLSFSVSAKTRNKNNPYLNERFVVNALRQVQIAQLEYRRTVGADSFGTFSALRAANLIDPALATTEKYGYSFLVQSNQASSSNPSRYSVSAVPRRYGKNGRRSFYIDDSCQIRGADKRGASAGVNDPVIEVCATPVLPVNERDVIVSLRTLHNAQVTYQATTGQGNYGTVTQLQNAGLLPPNFGFNFYRGYSRIWVINSQSPGNPSLYKIQASPEIYGRSGMRSFFVDQTGVIRGADRGGLPATVNDPPIEDE